MKLNILLLLLLLGISFCSAKSVEMRFLEEQRVFYADLTQVIYLDRTDIIQVTTFNNGVKIKAVKPGSASVILVSWANKELLKVVVKPSGLEIPEASRLDYSGKQFNANLSMGYGSGWSDSIYSQNKWTYGYTYYRLGTSGETPWGLLGSQIYIKNRADVQGLNGLTVSLKNGSGLWIFGDQYPQNKSSMIFPSQPLQGLSYEGRNGSWDFFAFYGANNYGNWGSVMQREPLSSQTLSYVKADYLVSAWTTAGLNLSNYGGSAAIKTLFQALSMAGEYGLDTQSRTALDLSAAYNGGVDARGSVGYKDYAEGFSLPIGNSGYSGYKGLNYQLSYQPQRLLSLGFSGENYTRRLSGQQLSDDRHHLQAVVHAEKLQPLFPELVLGYWDQAGDSFAQGYNVVVVTASDYSYLVTPTYTVTTTNLTSNYQVRQNGFSAELRKQYAGIDAWIRYQPVHFLNLVTSNSNYDRQSTIVGVKVPLLGNMFSWQGELGWDQTQMPTYNYDERIYRSFMVLSPIPIYDNRFFLNGFYQVDSRLNTRTSEAFSKQFMKAEMVYQMNPDSSLIASVYRTIEESPAVYQTNKILDEMRLEYSQNFNYRLHFENRRSILTGVVYRDDNDNQALDSEESGLPDIRVTLSDGRSMTTNLEGVYRFEDVPFGLLSVGVDETSKKLILTEESPKQMNIVIGDRYVANFGVHVSDKISGVVYLDRNADGILNAGEPGVPGVRILWQDQVARTDARGNYEFVMSQRDQREMIQLDVASLPADHRLTGSWKLILGQGETGGFGLMVEPKMSTPDVQESLIEISDIREVAQNQLMVVGHLRQSVLVVYMNDIKVRIEPGDFQIMIPKKDDRLKVKLILSKKRIWMKYFPYGGKL